MDKKIMKKVEDIFLVTKNYKKTVNTSELRSNLLLLMGITIFLIAWPYAFATTISGWIARIILIVIILKVSYDTYKITKIFEEWERNYNKYKKYFV